MIVLRWRCCPASGAEIVTVLQNVLQWFDAVGYALRALALRAASATVLWISALAKPAKWGLSRSPEALGQPWTRNDFFIAA